MSNAAVAKVPQFAEKRRYQRVKIAILGRYMLSDRKEYPCQTIDISPGGVALTAPVTGAIGERVVVYLEHVGRIEGLIVRLLNGGFAMTIVAPQRKRDKLAGQLTWLANRQALGLPEDRRHERIEPRRVSTTLTLPDARIVPVRLIDISMSGAAMLTEEPLDFGDEVTVGRTRAQVVRLFAGGVAVEFMNQIPAEKFNENVEL